MALAFALLNSSLGKHRFVFRKSYIVRCRFSKYKELESMLRFDQQIIQRHEVYNLCLLESCILESEYSYVQAVRCYRPWLMLLKVSFDCHVIFRYGAL